MRLKLKPSMYAPRTRTLVRLSRFMKALKTDLYQSAFDKPPLELIHAIYDFSHAASPETTPVLCLLSKRALPHARGLLYRDITIGAQASKQTPERSDSRFDALHRALQRKKHGKSYLAALMHTLHLQTLCSRSRTRFGKAICGRILSIAGCNLHHLTIVDFVHLRMLQPHLLPQLRSLTIRSASAATDGSPILTFLSRVVALDRLVLDFPSNIKRGRFTLLQSKSQRCLVRNLSIEGGVDAWDSGGDGLDFWMSLLDVCQPLQLNINFSDIQVGLSDKLWA